MKKDFLKKIFFSMATLTVFTTFGHQHQSEQAGHAHVFTPEEEAQFYREAHQKGDFSILDFRFEQTSWRECTDVITGNYTNYNCANRRGISVILKDFMDAYMPACVQEGLDVINAGELDQLHIIHDGILGDRRHSPRSMHAENRAIDIRAFKVTLMDGSVKTLRFNDRNYRDFYRGFRNCWGKVVNEHNGCPFYSGSVERTGSIGWEDKNHQNHMHTSVPYCVGGSYGSYYYNR